MSDGVAIRPLTAADIPAAGDVIVSALPPPPGAGWTPEWEARMGRRCARAVEHDPEGSWVADIGERVRGVALSLRRGPLWVLSMLAVDPTLHGGGIGRQLIDHALRTWDDARGGLIAASGDPRALRLYARSGFDLHPTVTLHGSPDRSAIPAHLDVRDGDPARDLDLVAAVDERIRGGARTQDVELMLDAERRLYVRDDGYVVAERGTVIALAATTEPAARALYWRALADAAPDGHVEARWVTAGQDWAIDVALTARLTIEPGTPIFTRGELGPLRPFMPSGAFL